jgi:hypothetical protein
MATRRSTTSPALLARRGRRIVDAMELPSEATMRRFEDDDRPMRIGSYVVVLIAASVLGVALMW